ncbi:spore coat protein [Clostridium niameyense]|uniref:Spore coat protein n=1 Tax=Clostridium niameyense TaxID=1622073 RepID=A0A6M0R9Z6_9CLOT|nr:spore coat protein [Clostridium niameyense]NEZ47032.1 spore coat protein [Clostridium niameyense]
MNNNLSQKERMLLEDQKSHEQLCIEKYTNYANQAQDPQLKQIFLQSLEDEKQHLNTINQMLNGQVPNLAMEKSKQQNSNKNMNAQMPSNNTSAGLNSKSDKELCEDILMTEKYVSSTYDTSIFEFTNTTLRDDLNHIQKEEQNHGKAVFDYMHSKGMYNVK